jgi:hypothetical protein
MRKRNANRDSRLPSVRACTLTGVIPPAALLLGLGWRHIVGDEALDVSAHLRGQADCLAAAFAFGLFAFEVRACGRMDACLG